MRVFLTGGTGFIGSHIITELLARGDGVTVLARNPDKIRRFLDTPGMRIVEGGLDDHDLIRAALEGQDACIHNAIYWEDEPTELQLKDTRTAVDLFESAAEAGVEQLIYTSSTAVHRPFRPVMSEQDRLTPTDFYGATKAAAEVFLSAFSYQTNMRVNIVRPGPTVGTPAVEGAPIKGDRRFTSIVQAAMRGEEIRVVRHDGRQFIGVRDLAKVYSALLRSKVNRQTYIATARDFTTWEQIAELAVRLTGGSNLIVSTIEDGIGETPNLFDVSKLERELGLAFDSQVAITEHLEALLASETSAR